MRSIELTVREIGIVRTPLEMAVPGTITTVRELRVIDKILDKLTLNGLSDVEAEQVFLFEDADFEFLKTRFESFPGWNPANSEVRKEVMVVAAKLGV